MVGKKWKMLSKVIKTYNHALLKCPFIINCFTGFSVATIGDFAAQKYVYMKKNIAALEIPFETSEWDGTRAVEMGVIRACFITPFILFWYPTLQYLFPGKAFRFVLCRIFLDQLVGSPIVIALVFSLTSIRKGNTSTLLNDAPGKFQSTWLTGLQYWPLVHAINFGFVPLAHQPLFAHFASVYWNAVLSYYSYSK